MPEQVTQAEVERLRGLLEKGAPETDSGWYVSGYSGDGLARISDGTSSGIFPIKCEMPQAALIVAAVNALPSLLSAADELSRMREALRAVQEAILDQDECEAIAIIDTALQENRNG